MECCSEAIIFWAGSESLHNKAEESRNGGVTDTIDKWELGVEVRIPGKVYLQGLSACHGNVVQGSD